MLKRPELAHLPELKTDKGQEELIDNIKKTLLIEAVTRRLFQMTYNARDPQLAQLVHAPTWLAVHAERAVSRALGAIEITLDAKLEG